MASHWGRRVYSNEPGGMGGTYSGNPLACVAGIETIKTIADPKFLARSAAIGDKIRHHLEQFASRYPLIGDVRGLCPMLAAVLAKIILGTFSHHFLKVLNQNFR